MTFDLHTAVSSLAVSFAHFLIGSWKRVLLWCLFSYFLHIVFFHNPRRLMSQMIPMKNNLINLDLNPGHLVRSVPECVGCYLA